MLQVSLRLILGLSFFILCILVFQIFLISMMFPVTFENRNKKIG
jgi:hypothetical protein